MPLMPFQILGLWFRGLLTLALLVVAGLLLAFWYNHREVLVEVTEEREVVVSPDPAASPLPQRRVEVVRREEVRHWHFGGNRETASLLGGLSLLVWSLGGGLLTACVLGRWRGKRDASVDSEPVGAVRRLPQPDGTELYVEFHGPADAPVVILTHGWGLNSSEWRYARRDLAKHYRVITWDLPGLGRSGQPRDKDYSLERMAHDLNAIIGLAGDMPVVLVGHSIGGMITLTWCRLFPQSLGERVRGLVLALSTYTNPVRTTRHAALYAALQKPLLEPLCHLTVWMAPLLWLLNWLSYLCGSAHRSTAKASFSGQQPWHLVEEITRMWVGSWPAVLARGFLAMFRFDATEVLKTIRVPTLVVAGDRDDTCLPEASTFMVRTISEASLLTLTPARHAGAYEHHAAFDEAVVDFVAACCSPVAALR